MFVDKAQVLVEAGAGGNGKVGFRHEKFVERGGPDGGDGGKGGDVVFVADNNLNTLLHFRYKQGLSAKLGGEGNQRKQHGRNGDDLVVSVPVGTVVYDLDNNQIADLIEPDVPVIIAKGGKGGFGNAHFISSTRRAPRVAELGEPGESLEVKLELKLLADVGLIGLPNAGKSTFLSVVSNARPEIADHPFTTLTPHLGVADVDDSSLLIADIPGLIEGAAKGKGLGDDFLRHIERTGVLLHLIDAWSNDVAANYKTIQNELKNYQVNLTKKSQIIVLTKIDGIDEDIVDMQIKTLKKTVPKITTVLTMSSVSGKGIKQALRSLQKTVVNESAKQTKEAAIDTENIPTIELNQAEKADAWSVVKHKNKFEVSGQKIEGFALRTDFDNRSGVERLRDIMQKLGIMHELERQGIQPGDKIKIVGSKDHLLY